MYRENKECFICGNTSLIPITNLGNSALTGVFPKQRGEKVESGPLELVKCEEDEEGLFCGLVQLRHVYELNKLYGLNYGYRSGLNRSMVEHLHNKVRRLMSRVALSNGDLIIDVGSNDSTLLQAYSQKNLLLVGIDPTGKKFKEYYPPHIHLIPDFFSANALKSHFGNKKAKIITSIAMFYDLERPLDFMQQIYDSLADDGIWVFEQSYMPTMLEMNAYDTICHEHLEFYALKQIKYMTDRIGLKIIDIEFNTINGGSFSLTVAKYNSPHKGNDELVDNVLSAERNQGLSSLTPYRKFEGNMLRHREELLNFIHDTNKQGKKVLGYGASTKGNVILQFCGITPRDIPYIAEVNSDKFGSFTPGTLIPIISEEEAFRMKPDYLMVLPWHFKEHILSKEAGYLNSGGHLCFPLPKMEIV
jgi:hypothetical protein